MQALYFAAQLVSQPPSMTGFTERDSESAARPHPTGYRQVPRVQDHPAADPVRRAGQHQSRFTPPVADRLWHHITAPTEFGVTYWRDGTQEVDFVVTRGKRIWATESLPSQSAPYGHNLHFLPPAHVHQNIRQRAEHDLDRMGWAKSGGRTGNFEIPTDLARHVFVDFAVPRDRRRLLRRAVHVDGMASALAQKFTPVPLKVALLTTTCPVPIEPVMFNPPPVTSV